MSNHLRVVLEEGQKAAQQLPLKRRASLYRGLAEVCGHPRKAADFLALAKQCDELRRREKVMQMDLTIGGDGE